MITGILIGIVIGAGATWCGIFATQPTALFEVKNIKTLFPRDKQKNGKQPVHLRMLIKSDSIGASKEVVLKGAVYPKDLTPEE